MTRHLIYSDAVGSTIEVTAYSRLYQWSATTHAKEGSVSHSTLVIDDPDAILDFVGHRRIYAYEDTAPALNQVMHNGFIQSAKVSRGPYRNGTSRIWTLDLADQNVLLHRRLMNGVDANRPAETDVRRMEALIGIDDGIPMTELNTIDDTLYFSGVDPVDMDPVDYRTQFVGTGYIDDCAQASGKNHHCWYREATGEFSLWYDFAASSNCVSTKRLSNVRSDVDGTTTFAVGFENEAILDRDYSRVASGVMLPFDGVAVGSNTIPGTIYVQDQNTTDTFAAIDWLAPSFNVKTKAKALARAQRYLTDAGAGDDLITCFVELPAANVNDILAGQRIEARFEHFPLYGEFNWFRILARTVTELSEDPTKAYRLELELTPIEVPGVPSFFTHSTTGACESGSWPLGSPGAGSLLVSFCHLRDSPNFVSGMAPIGYTGLPGTCAQPDVAGTGWTYINGHTEFGGAGQNVPMALAYRDSVAGEPVTVRWGGGTGFNGTSRARGHYAAFPGFSGAPTVTASGTGSGNGTFASPYTSEPITVPGAGRIALGMGYRCTGPADGASSSFVMTVKTGDAVIMTQGFQAGGFGGFGALLYLDVTAAGTYSVPVYRSATPRTSYAIGWEVAFWPA